MRIPIYKIYHVQWRTFICINFVVTYSLRALYIHIEYMNAILESIIQSDCYIRNYRFIFGCYVRGVGHLHL